MNEVDDYLLVWSASTTKWYIEELSRLIANLSPSDLSDLGGLKRKLNFGLKEKGLTTLFDAEYVPRISKKDLEERLSGKNGILNFALRVDIAQHGDSDLSENMKQLQRALQSLAAELDDAKNAYILRNNESKEVFMEISYDEFKQSKRCSTDRGTYGFLKDTISAMLSKDYAGDKELVKVIGNDKNVPAWYEDKLMGLAMIYWDKTFKELPKIEVVTKEKEPTKWKEEELFVGLSALVKKGERINVDKAVRRENVQTAKPKT